MTLRWMAPLSTFIIPVGGTDNHKCDFLYDHRDPWSGTFRLSGHRGGSLCSLQAVISGMTSRDGMAIVVGH
ncbi:hypothetical protein BHE74_00025275 [Ensete ventricosum]|nr:hypothetical protein GW17_00010773 [Ensete ventricosum]RWW67289.1 hypothetical protein BHE74_00025275 [Ensete ventricosum]